MDKELIMKNHLILILLLTSLLSFGQNEFETLNGENYIIKYPNTWELNQSGQMGMTFGLFSPVGLYGDQFRENVNLIEQDISSQDLDLAGYIEVSENQIKTLLQASTIIESKREKDYHKIIYTGTMGRYKLKFHQRYWVKNGNAYVLTFTAEIGEYDNYNEIALQIMDSFEFK